MAAEAADALWVDRDADKYAEVGADDTEVGIEREGGGEGGGRPRDLGTWL